MILFLVKLHSVKSSCFDQYLTSFGFSFLKCFYSFLYFRVEGRYFATHILLRAANSASALEILQQDSFVELLSVNFSNGVEDFGWIFGGMPSKDVSMFVEMLTASFICDILMPFWFLEIFFASVL